MVRLRACVLARKSGGQVALDAPAPTGLQEIDGLPGLNREERVRLWEERTGFPRAIYYRRLEVGRTNPAAD